MNNCGTYIAQNEWNAIIERFYQIHDKIKAVLKNSSSGSLDYIDDGFYCNFRNDRTYKDCILTVQRVHNPDDVFKRSVPSITGADRVMSAYFQPYKRDVPLYTVDDGRSTSFEIRNSTELPIQVELVTGNRYSTQTIDSEEKYFQLSTLHDLALSFEDIQYCMNNQYVKTGCSVFCTVAAYFTNNGITREYEEQFFGAVLKFMDYIETYEETDDE